MINKPITGSRRDAGKVWMTTYVVDALPPARGNISEYTVYQEWTKTSDAHRRRCDKPRTHNAVVTRQIGDDRLTICLGPHPTRTARTYWQTVPFTDDLDAVDWLPDPGKG